MKRVVFLAAVAALFGAMTFASFGQARLWQAPLDCDKACLTGFVDSYLAAMVAHDSKRVALAPNAKLTENTQVMPFTEGLWKNATAGPFTNYKIYVPDPVSGQVGFMGVIRELASASPAGRGAAGGPGAGGARGPAAPGAPGGRGPGAGAAPAAAGGRGPGGGAAPAGAGGRGRGAGTAPAAAGARGFASSAAQGETTDRPIQLGLRLKIENKQITEAEHIIARLSDNDMANFQVPAPRMLETVPEAQRFPRETMLMIGNSYYDSIVQSDGDAAPYADECSRRENGRGTAGAAVRGAAPAGGAAAPARGPAPGSGAAPAPAGGRSLVAAAQQGAAPARGPAPRAGAAPARGPGAGAAGRGAPGTTVTPVAPPVAPADAPAAIPRGGAPAGARGPGARGCRDQMFGRGLAYIQSIDLRRVWIADVDKGLVFGMTMFRQPYAHVNYENGEFTVTRDGTGNPFDLPAVHIFKIIGGKIYDIEAMGFTMPLNSKNGWSEFIR